VSAAATVFHTVENSDKRFPCCGKSGKYFSIVWKNQPVFSTPWKNIFHTVENSRPDSSFFILHF